MEITQIPGGWRVSGVVCLFWERMGWDGMTWDGLDWDGMRHGCIVKGRGQRRTPAQHVNAQCSAEGPSLKEEVRWQFAAEIGDVEPIYKKCQLLPPIRKLDGMG